MRGRRSMDNGEWTVDNEESERTIFALVRFQRAERSFHAIWKAMEVLPVPVVRVRSERGVPSAIA